MSKLGYTDISITSQADDKFSLSPYVKSLTEFIENCDTPMSIAIQGDWGCGKTSFMNLIKESLDDNAYDSVWFNTWQFSQFNTAESLPITFLTQLCNNLTNNSTTDKNPKQNQLKSIIKDIGKTMLVGVTNSAIGDTTADYIKDKLSGPELDISEIIINLKTEFGNLITNNPKKVVIFVDDLDRLQPVRAIELLEILKIFLDCENCIFILAIDTSVVFQGLKAKYGNDLSIEKQRSFFDKLIQLPFQVPFQTYDFKDYLCDTLPDDFYTELSKHHDDMNVIASLLRKTAMNNPRSVKRIINAFNLNCNVLKNKELIDSRNPELYYLSQLIIFTLVCFQSRFGNEYDEFLDNYSNRDKYTEIQIILSNLQKPVGINTYSHKVLNHRYQDSKNYQMSEEDIKRAKIDDILDDVINTLRLFNLKLKSLLRNNNVTDKHFKTLLFLSSSTSNFQISQVEDITNANPSQPVINSAPGTIQNTIIFNNEPESSQITDLYSVLYDQFNNAKVWQDKNDWYYVTLLPTESEDDFNLRFFTVKNSTGNYTKITISYDNLFKVPPVNKYLNAIVNEDVNYNKALNLSRQMTASCEDKCNKCIDDLKLTLASYGVNPIYGTIPLEGDSINKALIPICQRLYTYSQELQQFYISYDSFKYRVENDDSISSEDQSTHSSSEQRLRDFEREMQAALDTVTYN